MIQGNVKFRVARLTARCHETGMLIDCLLGLVQADSLTNPQNVVWNHAMGHAFNCRHHVRRADSPGRQIKDMRTMKSDLLHCSLWSKARALSSLQNKPNVRFLFPRDSCSYPDTKDFSKEPLDFQDINIL